MLHPPGGGDPLEKLPLAAAHFRHDAIALRQLRDDRGRALPEVALESRRLRLIVDVAGLIPHQARKESRVGAEAAMLADPDRQAAGVAIPRRLRAAMSQILEHRHAVAIEHRNQIGAPAERTARLLRASERNTRHRLRPIFRIARGMSNFKLSRSSALRRAALAAST